MKANVLSILGAFLIALGVTVAALQAFVIHVLQSHPLVGTGGKYIVYSVTFFTGLSAENGSVYTLALKDSSMRVELLTNGSYLVSVNGTAQLQCIKGNLIGEEQVNVTAVVPGSNPLAELFVLPQNTKYVEVGGQSFPLYRSSSGSFAAFGPSPQYSLNALVPGESVDAYYVKLGDHLVLSELNDVVLNSSTYGSGMAFMDLLRQNPFVDDLTTSMQLHEPTLMLYGVSTDLGTGFGLIRAGLGLPLGIILTVVGAFVLYASRRR